MMGGKFFGGVHPHYEKELSSRMPIEEMPLSEKLIVPFAQNLGVSPKSVIKKGDLVKRGQVIAEAQGPISVPVHAPTSGTVQSLDVFPHPAGFESPAAVIVPDGLDEWAEGLNTYRDLDRLEPEAIRSIIRDAGIVGLGGAAFPTHVKLSPPKDKTIDILIVNGAECEPYLTSDHRLMVEKPEEIIKGASLFASVLGARSVFIGIEKNKPDAIDAIEKPAKERGFEVRSLDVVYPQGAEKQLIYSLTGRRVPAGGLPMDVGVLVQNVGTCFAAFEAVAMRRPLIDRVVTVTGRGIRNPKNLRVRIGTPIGNLLSFCGGLDEQAGKIVAGGPMMGIAQFSLEAPVIKGTSGIVVLIKEEIVQFLGKPCIRCGRCVRACPMLLNPSLISILAERLRFQETAENHVTDCIECGCCAYVCPSLRPLVHHFKRAKAELRNMGAKTS